MRQRTERSVHRWAAVAVTLLTIAGTGVATAGATAASDAGARHGSTQHLTATVTTEKLGLDGDHVVLSLTQGKKKVGSVNFPGCEGAGTDVDCGGTVSVDGVGKNLQTIVTFHCGALPPCNAGKGILDTKGGVEKGTISLKVQPSAIKKGKKFPVIVTAED